MEEENIDNPTIFTIKHSDIPKGITQCLKHDWIKESYNEIKCTKCPTVAIINPNDMENYVHK